MTLADAVKALKDAGVDSPEYDARELFFHFLGLNRNEIIPKNRDFSSEELKSAIDRRIAREPLSYIIGEVGFYRETYFVCPSVLIPRQDTEILVDYAVKNIPAGETFLDLCTGSGCIAISTLRNTKDTRAIAADLSFDALSVAKKNAKRCGVSDRISFKLCDLLTEDIPTDERVYAILSNPPYVKEEVYEGLSAEIFREPKEAFVAGSSGMIFYERLLPMSLSKLKKGGFIAFEIGYDQKQDIENLARKFKCECKIIKDYSGNDRVAVIRPE